MEFRTFLKNQVYLCGVYQGGCSSSCGCPTSFDHHPCDQPPPATDTCRGLSLLAMPILVVVQHIRASNLPACCHEARIQCCIPFVMEMLGWQVEDAIHMIYSLGRVIANWPDISSRDLALSFDRATHISGFIVTLASLPFWIKIPCFFIIQISHAVHVRCFFFRVSLLSNPFHKYQAIFSYSGQILKSLAILG